MCNYVLKQLVFYQAIVVNVLYLRVLRSEIQVQDVKLLNKKIGS